MFVSAHVHLKGLEGSVSVFVQVSWLLAIQTESLLATSPFSDPLLFLSTIRCWNFLHTDTGVRSEWSCRYFYVITEITLAVFPWGFRHRLLVLLRIIISTHRLKKDGFTTSTWVKIDKKKQTKQKKHAHTHAHVETFVKADFAHIPLTAKKLWLAQNVGGCSPPPRPPSMYA